RPCRRRTRDPRANAADPRRRSGRRARGRERPPGRGQPCHRMACRMSRNVLMVRLDNNGDVLLAGPAIRAVAAGARSVTLLCGPRGLDAAELLPGVDDLIVFRAPWIDPEPQPVDPVTIAALVDDLRERVIDQ